MNFAMLFPGQGSQSAGMLNDAAAAWPSVRQTFEQASDTLGYDLWAVVESDQDKTLNQTAVTQPAMLTAGIALWRVWCEHDGPMPTFTAGHSLGEYSALVCAGALDFERAVALVAERGRLMQAAVAEGAGAVAAILGLPDEAVEAACAASAEHGVVAAVNFNAPGQVVIAGHRAAVDAALAAARAAGAKRAIMLPVSVPVHCSLMAPVAQALRPQLEAANIRKPSISVVHNLDAAEHAEVGELLEVLGGHLYSPVLWAKSIEYMLARGATALIECGPGKVLTGLNRRISRRTAAASVFDPESLASALAATGVSA